MQRAALFISYIEKGNRLEYQFKLKKPLPSSKPIEQYRTPSSEQITLVDSVTETLLIMLAKQLLAEGERRQLSGPFELFELNEGLCDLLGLERSRVLMLELAGDKPELIWEDDDLRALRARDVADLLRVAAGLEAIRRDDWPFTSLMADTPVVDRRGGVRFDPGCGKKISTHLWAAFDRIREPEQRLAENICYGILNGSFRNLSPRSVSHRRELVAVAVSHIYYDPVVLDRLIQAALEIAIAHFEKMIALKDTARQHLVAHKNAEDLAGNVVVRRAVSHKSPLSNKFNNIRSRLSHR